MQVTKKKGPEGTNNGIPIMWWVTGKEEKEEEKEEEQQEEKEDDKEELGK